MGWVRKRGDGRESCARWWQQPSFDRARRSTRTFESGHDGGQLAVELHVDDGTDHLGHAAIGGRVRRRRGGEPAREGGLRFDNTARDGALRLAHFRKAPGQPRPGNPGRGGPKSLPGEASGDTRETSHGDDVTEISTSPRGVLARPTLRSASARNRGSFTRSSDPSVRLLCRAHAV